MVALIFAGVALGWNIYRDVILKARVRVSFAIVKFFSHGDETIQLGESQLRIAVTNHGPGPVKIEMISGQIAPLLRRLTRRPEHFVILRDQTNPLNPRLNRPGFIGELLT